jgi:hypothetical protein
VQLDRGALGVEAKSGLALLVGADAIIGDESAYDGTALPSWIVVPTLPYPRARVQTLQTLVCLVTAPGKAEPELHRASYNDSARA